MPNILARLTRMASSSSSGTPRQEQVEQVSLTDLNNLLEILADAFPAHDTALLRTILLEASPESRLHIAAHALVQHPERYAGRLTRRPQDNVAEWEKFRSTKYMKTVQKLLVAEFQALATSTVRGVLAENNYDYARSRAALVDVAAKSWRFNLTAWFTQRKPPRRIDAVPKPTGCARLDTELHALGLPARAVQSTRDAEYARAVNTEEHIAAQGLLECECCFGDATWEELTACTQGHLFCTACLARSVQEALFGQGSGLHATSASVRCISSVADPPCDGFVASALLASALPPETLARLEQRFARDGLRTAGLQLLWCPACFYAVEASPPVWHLRLTVKLALFAHLLYLCRDPRGVLIAFAWLVLYSLIRVIRVGDLPKVLHVPLAGVDRAFARVRRRRTGARQRFRCENPQCRMESCVDCGRTWAAFHDCRREDSERLHVERAMSEAVKRTCPQCHTSFVKTDGCNKLTCPCGYEMCYVCRVDVRWVRYGHFCPHFRVVPGTRCQECELCNLYEGEDEQAVAKAAARQAAKEWARGAPGTGGDALDTELLPAPVEKSLEYLIELLFEW